MPSNIKTIDPLQLSDEDVRSDQYADTVIELIAKRYADQIDWFRRDEVAQLERLRRLAKNIGHSPDDLGASLDEDESYSIELAGFRSWARSTFIAIHRVMLDATCQRKRPVSFSARALAWVGDLVAADAAYLSALGIPDDNVRAERVPKLVAGTIGILTDLMADSTQGGVAADTPMRYDSGIFRLAFGDDRLVITPPDHLLKDTTEVSFELAKGQAGGVEVSSTDDEESAGYA